MIWLVLGLFLWIGAHLFRRLAPKPVAAHGKRLRGVLALSIVAGLVLMVIGYRAADVVPLWSPPQAFVHLNNLMMLGAVFLFGMSATTGRLRGRLRHPMLLSVIVWAVAHLLVNGDLASLVLFGGLGVWALAEIVLINRAEPWDRPAPGPARKDILLVIITLVAYAVIAGIHILLGVDPFG